MPTPTRRAAAPPPTLNDRQQAYLLAAYRTDQQVEAERKLDYLRGLDSDRRPAAEWRPMPYGCWEHILGRPATLLREALTSVDAALVSEGTGSTWRALAQRGLLEVSDRVPVLVQDYVPKAHHYTLPHVRLTPAGRRLARQLTGEVREKKTNALARAIWQLLVNLWEHDPNLPAGHRPAFSGSEAYLRLERQLPARKVLGRENHERLVQTGRLVGLTMVGRIYYYQHYAANVAAHPDIAAPDPGPLSPELTARVEQLENEARVLLHAPPAGAFRQWQLAVEWGGRASWPIYLEPYQAAEAVKRGLPDQPPPAASPDPAGWGTGDGLRNSWRRFLRDYHLRHQLSPAEWNCYLLWHAVELCAGRLQWLGSEINVEVYYWSRVPCIYVHLSRYPGLTEIQRASAQALQLARQHGCARWLLDMRHVDELARLTTRRHLVSALLGAGEQLHSTHGRLRVAVSAPQVPLTEWRLRLPDSWPWWAVEWHEAANVPAAEAWLAQASSH